ncbi:MAG: hypothetical protein KF817_05625 [Phycisphaeraceae bacterium]|nr:hypothetical protein [Phycisphaeraceae bacterium]
MIGIVTALLLSGVADMGVYNWCVRVLTRESSFFDVRRGLWRPTHGINLFDRIIGVQITGPGSAVSAAWLPVPADGAVRETPGYEYSDNASNLTRFAFDLVWSSGAWPIVLPILVDDAGASLTDVEILGDYTADQADPEVHVLVNGLLVAGPAPLSTIVPGTLGLRDVGWFEFAPCCREDFDESGTVDSGDLMILLGAWGPCPSCRADLNNDGTVDFDDLLLFLTSWGPCTPV